MAADTHCKHGWRTSPRYTNACCTKERDAVAAEHARKRALEASRAGKRAANSAKKAAKTIDKLTRAPARQPAPLWKKDKQKGYVSVAPTGAVLAPAAPARTCMDTYYGNGVRCGKVCEDQHQPRCLTCSNRGWELPVPSIASQPPQDTLLVLLVGALVVLVGVALLILANWVVSTLYTWWRHVG